MKPPLLLNAVSTLVLHGLATNKHASATPLVLKRSTAIPLEITYLCDPEKVKLEDVPPPRLPSRLPPPGEHTLALNIGQRIEGRVGMIHSVVVDASASSAAESFLLPPLVVKICAPGRTSDMLNEAASYDEMELLQGVCVPRCYGLFQTSYDLEELNIPVLLDRKKRDEELRCELEEDSDDDKILEPIVYDNILSVLLIERVGDRLQLGRSLPHGVREDMTDMYNDLARLYLCHNDIRYSKFLSVLPEDQGGLPSLASPFTGRTYRWRAVDFDSMKKTVLSEESFSAYHLSYILRLLNNVPYGCIVEPWE
ncbi:hypothetical protein EV421DRAFT_428225 [Armillaria borealis]|uniref:Protein kinase domain-containing protein n=1 Tax=Armillaria borealis TaxID=47425 RepID=A0AA39K717_9AGAR|nr:hypothetical protein EV421DRAFT_428225 [Armillaria borealis]